MGKALNIGMMSGEKMRMKQQAEIKKLQENAQKNQL